MQNVLRKNVCLLGKQLKSIGSEGKVFGALNQIRFFQDGSGEHIESLVKGKKIVMFMKGTPDNPKFVAFVV